MIYLEMSLWVETCCKKVSHMHQKQPLVVIDGILLSLNYYDNRMNQIKIS